MRPGGCWRPSASWGRFGFLEASWAALKAGSGPNLGTVGTVSSKLEAQLSLAAG